MLPKVACAKLDKFRKFVFSRLKLSYFREKLRTFLVGHCQNLSCYKIGNLRPKNKKKSNLLRILQYFLKNKPNLPWSNPKIIASKTW